MSTKKKKENQFYLISLFFKLIFNWIIRIEPDAEEGRQFRLFPDAARFELRQKIAQSRASGQQDQRWVILNRKESPGISGNP